LINVPDRLLCISLIREAVQSGCRLEKACEELGLSLRTFQRWARDGEAVRADGRTTTERPAPRNKLSEAERQQILEVANSAEFASLPPSQIVPSLADRGVYLASESSFYRVLRSASQQHHRGRARQPSARVVTSHCATAPNQVWSWDITWMPAAIKGKYYYWYMVLDVFSHALSRSVNFFCSTSTSPYDEHPAPARGQRRCPQHEAVDSPPDGGSVVAHGLPARFAFGLTRRCAACPNQTGEQDPILTESPCLPRRGEPRFTSALR